MTTSPYHVCSACDGTGEWRGMFEAHRSPCAPCAGVGLVLIDGSPLDADQVAHVVRAYRQLLRTRSDQVRRLQGELDRLRPQRSPDDTLREAVYPPGSRYHGD